MEVAVKETKRCGDPWKGDVDEGEHLQHLRQLKQSPNLCAAIPGQFSYDPVS